MKALFFLSALIFITSPLVNSVSLIHTSNWPYYAPSSAYNGYYYFTDVSVGVIYNISTGEAWALSQLIPACKSDQLYLTSQNEFFCLTQSGRNATWHQFSPLNFSVLSKVTYEQPGNVQNLVQSDEYITYLISKLNAGEWTSITYNLITQEYLCNVTYPGGRLQTTADFIGSGILYPSLDADEILEFAPCSGNSLISTHFTTPIGLFSDGIFNLNQSTVLVGSTPAEANVYNSQAALIDLTGTIYRGPKYGFQATQYNDTHLIAPFPEGGYWQVGLFTVGSSLNFILVAQMNTSVNSNYSIFPGAVTAIPGSDAEFMVNFEQDSAYTYSFDKEAYTGTFPNFPPFQLANGSWVNLTLFGYFIQSPGEPIYYLEAPYSTMYVDPTFNDVFTLYIPSPINKVYGVSKCLLTQYQRNTSTISQFVFSKCPPIDAFPNLEDVSFDDSGNPVAIIAFIDIYLVTLQGFSKIMQSNAENMIVSVNMTNGTGIVVYSSSESFKISKFYTNNGSIYETASSPLIFASYDGNSIQKLTDQYYLLASCNLTSSAFTVWDTVNQVAVEHYTVNQSFIILVREEMEWRVYQYPTLGVVGNGSSVVDAIVWGYTDEINVRDINGNITKISISTDVSLDIYQIGYDSFWSYTSSGWSLLWQLFEL